MPHRRPSQTEDGFLTMKVLICFKDFSEPFDVAPHCSVGAMKQMVKDTFFVQLTDNKQVRQYLELNYAGAALQDSWALCDVGIAGGSAIRCLIKSEQRPVILVFNAVTGETLPIMGSEDFLHRSVAELKTVVSVLSALPVSAFRLSTPSGVPLYDCNQLHDYNIDVGTTLRLDTWDGWVELLLGCLMGHRLTVQNHLSEKKSVMRFQLQVALYIASSLGHLDLAGWLLEQGTHAEKPVGVHPYRQWCLQTAHRDTGKCAIHVAAESDKLLILKLFVTKNPMTLACRDPAGRDPLKVALLHGHRECVRYLANKLCSVVSLPNMSLPMRVYLQIKRWVNLGQKRAAAKRCQELSAAFKDRVGDPLLVDGFNQPKMSSKSRKAVTKPRRGIKAKALQSFPLVSNLLSMPHFPSKMALPQLHSQRSLNYGGFTEMQEEQKQDVKIREEGHLHEISKGGGNVCIRKLLLPPITSSNLGLAYVGASRNAFHVPKLFPHHCGPTPRENAAYCLTMARSVFGVLYDQYLHREALVEATEHSEDLDQEAGPTHSLNPDSLGGCHPDVSAISPNWH